MTSPNGAPHRGISRFTEVYSWRYGKCEGNVQCIVYYSISYGILYRISATPIRGQPEDAGHSWYNRTVSSILASRQAWPNTSGRRIWYSCTVCTVSSIRTSLRDWPSTYGYMYMCMQGCGELGVQDRLRLRASRGLPAPHCHVYTLREQRPYFLYIRPPASTSSVRSSRSSERLHRSLTW